jgi:glycerate kinase
LKSKILVASDKYKGSLSAVEVCSIIKDAIKKIDGGIDVVV